MTAPDTTCSGRTWDGVIAAATTRVVNYLATSNQPFDPSTLLAQSMLSLLDHYTLCELIKERNGNQLCGLLGCAGALALHDIDSMHSIYRKEVTPSTAEKERDAMQRKMPQKRQQTRCDCRLSSTTRDVRAAALVMPEVTDSENGDDDDGNDAMASDDDDSRAKSWHAGDESKSSYAPAREESNVVYNDDMYTEESFRLARRQACRMRRLRYKDKKQRQAMQLRLSSAASSSSSRQAWRENDAAAGNAATTMPSSGVCSAHFCSVECADIFDAEVWPRVSRHVLLHSNTVIAALANLFPKLPVHRLEQLARQSVCTTVDGGKDRANGGGAVILGAVKECEGAVSGVADKRTAEDDVQQKERRGRHADATNISNGDDDTRRSDNSDPTDENIEHSSVCNDSTTTLLCEMLDRMHVLRRVWTAETVARFPALSATRWGCANSRATTRDAHAPPVHPDIHAMHDRASSTDNAFADHGTRTRAGDEVCMKQNDNNVHHLAACSGANTNDTKGSDAEDSRGDGDDSDAKDGLEAEINHDAWAESCEGSSPAAAAASALWPSEQLNRPGLHGALLVIDYCMHMSNTVTRNLLLAHYIMHRHDIVALVRAHPADTQRVVHLVHSGAKRATSAASPPTSSTAAQCTTATVVMRVIASTLDALERSAQGLYRQFCGTIKAHSTTRYSSQDQQQQQQHHHLYNGRANMEPRLTTQSNTIWDDEMKTAPTGCAAGNTATETQATSILCDPLDTIAVTRALAAAALARAQSDNGAQFRVRATQQGARRELLLTHLFSPATAATLSRVLRCDYTILTTEAWNRVWASSIDRIHIHNNNNRTNNNTVNKDGSDDKANHVRQSANVDAQRVTKNSVPMSCLSFPAAVPAALLRPASVSPEVVMLGMVFFLAAACVSAPVLRYVLQSGGEIALMEVMRTIGVSEDDLRIAVLTLLRGEADDDEE